MGCIYSDTNKVDPVDEDTYRKAEKKMKEKNQGIPKCNQHEAIILQQLREEGFLSGPTSTASGGVSFEIMQKNPVRVPLRPPPRLEKLEIQGKVKHSQEEIKAKLARAEKRRREREEQQVKKLKIKSKEKMEAVGRIHKIREEKEEMKEKRILTVEENREKRLQEIRDRMKEREKYRQEVRRRKSLKKDGDEP